MYLCVLLSATDNSISGIVAAVLWNVSVPELSLWLLSAKVKVPPPSLDLTKKACPGATWNAAVEILVSYDVVPLFHT